MSGNKSGVEELYKSFGILVDAGDQASQVGRGRMRGERGGQFWSECAGEETASSPTLLSSTWLPMRASCRQRKEHPMKRS